MNELKDIFQKRFLKNKFMVETFWGLSAKGTAFLLYFSLQAYLARRLGVSNFGAWSFFYSIISIMLVLSYFGVTRSTRKHIAQYNATNMLNNVLRSSIKLTFMLSLIFALTISLFHERLALFIGRPDFSPLFLFSGFLILFAGLVELLKNIFTGLHRIKYHFIINLSEFSLKLILAFLFLRFSLGLLSILNSFIIATAATASIGFYLLYKNFYQKGVVGHESGLSLEILKYSLPLFIMSMGALVTTEIDTLMLGLLHTDKEVGIYSVAKQSVGHFPQIAVAIAIGTMPVFAKMTGENKIELRKIFNTLLKVNFFIFLFIVIVFSVFSKSLILLVFGEKYLGSVLPLQILLVYATFSSFALLFGALLDYQGRAWKRAGNLSFCIISNIALNFFLIPRHGATGAAIATAVSFLPYLILNAIEAKRVFASYD